MVACGGGSESSSTPSDTLDQAAIAQGERVYQANCATCHGADGEGQPNWQSPGPDGVYPAPPHDSSGHTWHHSDELLLEIIRRGGQEVYGSETVRSGMPAWGDRLSADEMRAVLAYLKTLWGPDEREFQAALE
ncbi:MAG: cytochrome c [Gemmatimonadota bacterium]